MSNWDNHTTREEQERQSASFDDGVIDGLDFAGYPLPGFALKQVKELWPYERGFLLGWWSKEWLKVDSSPVTPKEATNE
jgi:hypothetical protein